ncbi:hypothetical protein SAMD00019534_072630 [Acytostelium subglobosum LB1]|uniref:hypothetical protein n=1 Tax=Acytostelium subglobosum LB1 TaxID=1410327 RepID=UPI0006450A20|nr:hypothetical protein SAMD00019534_072630 [Acytostelium subglobosum LB1]GAM24088.1 hypothetical protein SAMD00019534_072630 [Acytostelium subglobosum LB1]|eukprot:XP_012753124.1 hypothetical protein SAMD00019534_072630 [Acytostelium subglobosum LB1]
MGKAAKASKKLDIQKVKKQRRLINKFKTVETKKLKTLNSRKNKRQNQDVEENEETEITQNTNIDDGEMEDDDLVMDGSDLDDDEDMIDGDDQDDDDEDAAEDEDDQELFDENDKMLMSKNKNNKKQQQQQLKSNNNKSAPTDEKKQQSDAVTNLKGQVAQHREDLQKLKMKDPELFAFMGENDSNLLNFGEDLSDDDEDDEEDDDVDADGETKDKQVVLTSELLDSWIEECEKQVTLKSLKKVMLAFKSAAHTGMSGALGAKKKSKKNANDEENEAIEKESLTDKDIPFKIVHSQVFNRTLIVCLQNIPKYLDQLLKYDHQKIEDEKARPRLPKTCEGWNNLRIAVKTYVRNVIYLVNQLSDPEMIMVALKGMEKIVCHISCFPTYAKSSLKILLQHWSASEESVRIMAFLCIRKLAIYTPYPFIDNCLKGVYLTYVRNSKFVSTTSLPIFNFMVNCVVEMFGLDFPSSYRHAFVYIRQLAIHLRNTLNKLNKESIQNIYNWLYMNSLRAWVEVLCSYPNQEQLKLLLFPITQLLFGVIGLTNSSKFFPLRFNCIRMLNKLAQTNGTFINSTPYLLDLLTTKDFAAEGKASTKNKGINFLTSLSVQDTYLNTKAYREGSRSQFAELMVDNMNIYSCHIGFPELAIPVLQHLKKFNKGTKNVKIIKQVKEIIDALNKQSTVVKNARDNVSFAPKDTKKVAEFEQTLRQKLGANGNAVAVLLSALQKKSKKEQEVLLQGTKVYDFDNDEDEELEDDQDDEDDQDGEFVDEDGDAMDEDDGEDEEEEVAPAKKQRTRSKKFPHDSTAEDVVEDLEFSDEE